MSYPGYECMGWMGIWEGYQEVMGRPGWGLCETCGGVKMGRFS